MRNTIILTALLLGVIGNTVTEAQSRTEEAKKRLEGKSSNTSISMIATAIELTLDVLPEFFYFRAIRPNEPRLSYNPTPYNRYNSSYGGIRTFTDDDMEAGQTRMMQLRFNTSMPQGTMAMEQFAFEAKWHLRYWAIQSRYEQLREVAAPYPIRQFNIMVGRKFRFIENGDAGLYLGFRNVNLSNDNYSGPELLTDFSWYFHEPFSLNYTFSSMLQEYGFIRNHELNIGLHRGRTNFQLGHRWLDILGVHFRTISFGIGVNI